MRKNTSMSQIIRHGVLSNTARLEETALLGYSRRPRMMVKTTTRCDPLVWVDGLIEHHNLFVAITYQHAFVSLFSTVAPSACSMESRCR
ncbi:uncharacterized protein RCC_11508 [Ramularia collo-cygni]|uniref:Uncharacterized protein n=1 Tax=Ramularia collo-cygni TaxID=112498 RepID=A0A2D3VQX5_9PEZI|nr:uncharacterized protein RCC_11508 [Ramularia collo-cygni]CZT25839.1 uncharacterized protein RCC_11508 [Ramularia collo-cygni]